MNPTELAQALDAALERFQAKRAGARRFHKAALGAVDPQHCLGDWLVCVVKNDHQALAKRYGQEKAVLTSSSGTTGGYTVPVEFLEDLFFDVSTEAIIRPRALVVPMTSLTTLCPLPDATSVPAAGTAPWFGSILLQWTLPENTSADETAEPKWCDLELTACTLEGYGYFGNNLLADAPRFDTYLRRLLARAIAWHEDYGALRGDGVGKPRGIVGAPGSITVNRTQTGTIKLQDCSAMVAKLLPHSYPTAVWACSPGACQQVTQLTDGSGRAAWLANAPDPFDRRALGSLMGRPVYPTDILPALGTQGDLILIDPGCYVLGDRRLVDVEASTHPGFLTNRTAYRVIHRVAGHPMFGSAITLQDASSTVSPFVVLN